MSVKSLQKQTNQGLNKKRKSCFEITRVAFQNVSDDETDDDEGVETRTDTNFTDFEIGNSSSAENSKGSQEDLSNRTRFKVLRAACIRGRWNCNDSLDTGSDDFFSMDTDSRDCKRSKHYECEQPVNLIHSSLSLLTFPDGKTSICRETLMVESKITIPNLLGHQACNVSGDQQEGKVKSNSLSCSKQEFKRDGRSSEQSSTLPLETIVGSEVTNACRKVVNQSVDCLLVENKQIQSLPKSDHAMENFSDIPIPKGNMALLTSSENIGEKISKALDLAKEHVILTAHGEIERLKDKILELQSTIKRLEEENMQLRGMTIQHQVDVATVVTADLIDLSDD